MSETDTIIDAFDRRVTASPSAVALRWPQGSLTYAELHERARTLATSLRAHGVRPHDRVALLMDRSPELVVGELAILMCGGAVVPLDVLSPDARNAFLLDDTQSRLLLTHTAQVARARSFATSVVSVEELTGEAEADPLPRPAPSDVAYLFYTSGSTGTPKGVEVLHRNVVHLTRALGAVNVEGAVLHAASPAFDAATLEIWGPLLNGGACALAEPGPLTPNVLARAIAAHGIKTVWLTASLFNEIIDEAPECLRGVEHVLFGGEAGSSHHVARAQAALPAAQFWNGYGPTETTTFATLFAVPRPWDADRTSVPIGHALPGVKLLVVDDALTPVPEGEEGELLIGGAGVAAGYLNRDALTAERFVTLGDERYYRSGDRVRMAPEGALEYLGRSDWQVKLRGFRIELGEVNHALTEHPGVRTCVTVLREDRPGQKRLVAYVIPEGDRVSAGELRLHLAPRVPEFAIPSAFVWLEAIPKNVNGKVEVAELPAPETDRPELATAYRAPTNATERQLCDAWEEILGVRPVGIDDRFFDLGGNSLLLMRLAATLERRGGAPIDPMTFFRHLTVREQARALDGGTRASTPRRGRPRRPLHEDSPIAIVGMAARFPGARNVGEFWRNLVEGRETVRWFREEELDPSIPAAERSHPQYVRARGVLEGVDAFDAPFFGMSPLEARVTDPQQRLMLELSWEALEDAGYAPGVLDSRVGVFAGKLDAWYFQKNLLGHPDLIARAGALQVRLANEKDYIATRVAHRLDLRGPAISVHSACSTSLVAIALACDALSLGQCDMALAGGVSIAFPVNGGHVYQEGAMLSADGHTRTFDASSSGTVFSDGAGLVVLKRYDDALTDGDTVHALILGTATNNDGGHKASFTAPSIEGQRDVIQAALDRAGVAPESVSYIEAHGTGTPLGDPIEVSALQEAFGATAERGFCALGSVKTNIGHAVIAAGVAGLLKTALSLRDRILPPSLHFDTPNPAIDFENSPFYVNAAARPWEPRTGVRRAGVSSFGVGGTNAHAILEEAPPREPSGPSRPLQLLTWSARSEAARDRVAADLRGHLGNAPLSDVAHTLHVGRRAFEHRAAVVAESDEDAHRRLESGEGVRIGVAPAHAFAPIFLFPGQGAQYAGMGRSLYENEPVYREVIDRCAERLFDRGDLDLRALLFDSAPDDPRLAETRFTQPAIFATECALGALWRHWGVEPTALLGHSVGEFAAAVMAGIWSLEDAAVLVAERGELMQKLPPGSMAGVKAAANDVEPVLAELREEGVKVTVAGANSPKHCTLSGSVDGIARACALLLERGIAARELRTSHAFHSPMMDDAVAPFAELVADTAASDPTIPIASSVTGTWMTADDARSPAYWSRQIREPVLFESALRAVDLGPGSFALEVGPRRTLCSFARAVWKPLPATRVRASLTAGNPDSDYRDLLDTLGCLWIEGAAIDWRAFHRDEKRHRVPLPTYPFERKRHWVDPAPAQTPAPAAEPIPAAATTPTVSPPSPNPAPAPAASAEATPIQPMSQNPSPARAERMLGDLLDVMEDFSGIEVSPAAASESFLELGLDSLSLTQLATHLQNEHGVAVSFRDLMERYVSPRSVVEFIDSRLPAEAPAEAPAAAPAPAAPTLPPMARALPAVPNAPAGDAVSALIQEQLRIMAQQLELMRGGGAATPMTVSAPATESSTSEAPPKQTTQESLRETAKASAKAAADDADDDADAKPVIAKTPIRSKGADPITPKQRARLEALIRRYTARTGRSKEMTQAHRKRLSDPRAVAGFRPMLKELVYPLIVQRSKGPRVWDVDGNEYIDVLNGFGMNYFGWSPDFINQAVIEQLETGIEIGPQTPLAGEVAELFCELTGMQRVAFANTGTEAVMGAMRLARTVTGRSKIAIFAGAYHGNIDEVLVRGTKKLKTIPAAPGIPRSACENMLVLDYGTDESLEVLEQHADELAAVMVEPVQSRRPDLQPRAFLERVRALTERSGAALIFDEVITGFRVGPGGAQEYFGIRADIATYGKVVGGGLPVAMIAGAPRFLDALDGGTWQFGDDSKPEVGVTYLAGTFVRHPMALAACRAVLRRLKKEGPQLQERLNARTEKFAHELNRELAKLGVPLSIKHFASWWKPVFDGDFPFSDLMAVLVRDRGVHYQEGYPCFWTTSHGEEEIETVKRTFIDAAKEMLDSDFLPRDSSGESSKEAELDPSRPPVEGARLGRDPNGNPAWFVPNPDAPGKYMQVATSK